MKKIFTLLLTLLFTVSIVKADDISADQALVIASQFATASQPGLSMARGNHAIRQAFQPTMAHVMRSAATGKDNVYIVNLGNDQGFVVVSGEDGTEDEVLGYCDHGSFTYDNCPIQFKDLLTAYSAGVDSLRLSPSTTIRARTRAARNVGTVIIEPLLTTTWYQYAPYNKYCPEDCPTGCFPTAVAQVMNYWKWPRRSTGKVGKKDFSGHVYDWDNMIDDYDGTSYTEEQADAVAKLMADIGTAFGTMYAPGGSPTYFYSDALVKNFSYNADITTHSASRAKALEDVIRKDLDQKRPVLYSGSQMIGDAHALVCDGYTSDNYFHFNYGWGGLCDGFYKLGFLDYGIDVWCFTGVRPYDSEIQVIDGIEYGMLKNGTAEILNYVAGEYGKDNGDLVIPSTITDSAGNIYRVTRIKKNAFFRKGRFGKVTLGDNIEVIEPYTFMYTTINEVVLSDKMEVVPDQAFQLTGVKKLTIGSSVKRIGKQAFAHCSLKEVICKSPAFEVDDEAFFNCGSVDQGEWLGCITKLGAEAFAMAKFKETPNFTNLVEIGSQAFASCTFEKEEFAIPPKLKSISPDAFWGCVLSFFKVENNPYFLCSPYKQEYLCNSSGTSLIMTVTKRRFGLDLPESVVRLEPRSIRADVWTIPATVVEMEGAFKDRESLSHLTCLSVVPPEITDTSFNEKIFSEENPPRLHVPVGTYDLYANAPGWRRFWIIDEEEYNPTALQTRHYDMVLNGINSDNQCMSIPLDEVKSINVSEDGKSLVISLNGKDPITASIDALDSIIWKPSLVYGDTEVFELNESTLTVETQKCTIKFDATVIDDDVQLSVRNSVLKPEIREGVTRGFVIDLSLSDGRHELSGTVDIIVPVTVGKGERVCAAYLNEETGQWEPVCFIYDEKTGTATIRTNHLSSYSMFFVLDEYLPTATLEFYGPMPGYFPFITATDILLDIMSSDDPDKQMIAKFKDDMGLWQTIGLDGIWSIVNGVGESLGFTAEKMNSAVDIMGNIGTYLSILDVAAAEIRGDDVGVAGGTLKTVMNITVGKMAAAIGTPVMSVSMGAVAFIGVALEKFGTMVQQRKLDLFEKAYRYFYSKQGSAKVDGCYRSPRDWYELFYPAFAEGKMTKEQLDEYIKNTVTEYCGKFWSSDYSDAYTFACKVCDVKSLTSYPYPDLYIQKQINDNHFAELMDGYLKSVFNAIRKNLEVVSSNRYRKSLQDMSDIVNTKIEIRFFDSSHKWDEMSKYANWQVRFTDAPSSNADLFKRNISETGEGSMTVTAYSLMQNKMRAHLTLSDPSEKDQKSFDITIPDSKGKVTVSIDLDKGGVKVDTNPIKGLELTYMPETIDSQYDWYGIDQIGEYSCVGSPGYTISLDSHNNKRARFQQEVERFFNRHAFITVQLGSGIITIGDDIVGQFEKNGLTATGKFTINTSHSFKEQTIEEFVKDFNDVDNQDLLVLFNNLLNGTITHKIDCEYTIKRKSVDDTEYKVTYTGKGTYTFEAEVVDRVDNYELDNLLHQQHITVNDITTREIEEEGEVELKFTTTLNE
jgi:hypothetical protein